METGEWRYTEQVKEGAIPIDGVTKHAWDDDDIEMVKYWYEYTPEDIERIRMSEIYEQRNQFVENGQETQSDILDGLAEIGDLAASNAVTSEDIVDAITELAEIIAKMEA